MQYVKNLSLICLKDHAQLEQMRSTKFRTVHRYRVILRLQRSEPPCAALKKRERKI